MPPSSPVPAMDRRAFARSVLALPALAATASAEPPAPPVSSAARTFTHVGKEETAFLAAPEAQLAFQQGAGFLTHMWFGGSFPNYKQLRIRVYVDGEPTPSIDMELGLGAGVGFQDPAAPWGTRYSGVTGQPSGLYLNYRIPFSRSIRVTAQLPPGAPSSAPFWWIVRGLLGHPLQVAGFALPAHARLRLHALHDFTAQPFQQFDLAATPRSGLLFLVAIAARSGSFQFMEAQMRAYFGAATEPQFLSSGLEDYFLGTYYFNRGPYHLPVAGLTHLDAADHTFSAYRFHDDDPVVFHQGFRLACRCGERRGEKIFGGNAPPPPTTYTTYTWLYEW